MNMKRGGDASSLANDLVPEFLLRVLPNRTLGSICV